MRRYRFIGFLFFLFALPIAAQTAPIRVPSDVAASHLKSSPSPPYPPLAQMANIQGNVLLHIQIDPNGNVSPYSVVRGHPMLVPAAVDGIKRWKYSPFEFSGHPVSALTVVMVRFGNPANHDPEDKAEVIFQDKFWVPMAGTQKALEVGDLGTAEQALADAGNILNAAGSTPTHNQERWQWMMSMGSLRRLQKRAAEAEQHYTDALALEKDKKESPAVAASLSALGSLYYEENKTEQARDKLKKAVSIYQKNYKAASSVPSALAIYIHALVDDSWMLAKLAANEEEAARHCQVVLDMQKSLKEDDLKFAECKRMVSAGR
jgi:TonB family protein